MLYASLRFLVPHLRQVPDVWLHADLFQYLVSTRIVSDLIYTMRMFLIYRSDLQQLG